MSPNLPPCELQSRIGTARLELARLGEDPPLHIVQIFQRICEIAATTLSVERVGIWFLTEDRSGLRCSNLFEHSKQRHSEGVTLQVLDFPAYFTALEATRAISAPSAEVDPRTEELKNAYLVPLDIHSMLDAPIYREGKVIGVMCLEQTKVPREWTTEERDFASTLADCVTLKLKACDLREMQGVLRQSREQLFALEKADTFARVVAGAAHDFNNILTVIVGLAHELSTNRLLPRECRSGVDTILVASERGTLLVREMIAFGAPGLDRPRVIQPCEAIRKAMVLLSASAGAGCPVEFDAIEPVGRVFLDPSGFDRVLLNLVLNARDAMANGGKIRILVQSTPTENPKSHSSGQICISVSDSGSGIADEHLARVFEPFFTTKSAGKGTGLGLSIVKKIVERAGGSIQVQSRVGEGTRFDVYLPRVSTE